MIKTSLLLLLITMSTNCFSQTRNRKFEIIGNVSGVQDSTFIKLYDFSTGSNIFMDSTQVINGKFTFRGSINKDKDYQRVGIITPDFKNIKVFWLENNIIHFNAEKGKFHDAVITGSSMQNEENQLNAFEKQNSKNKKATDINYIKNHPNSFISGNLLKVYIVQLGEKTL